MGKTRRRRRERVTVWKPHKLQVFNFQEMFRTALAEFWDETEGVWKLVWLALQLSPRLCETNISRESYEQQHVSAWLKPVKYIA